MIPEIGKFSRNPAGAFWLRLDFLARLSLFLVAMTVLTAYISYSPLVQCSRFRQAVFGNKPYP